MLQRKWSSLNFQLVQIKLILFHKSFLWFWFKIWIGMFSVFNTHCVGSFTFDWTGCLLPLGHLTRSWSVHSHLKDGWSRWWKYSICTEVIYYFPSKLIYFVRCKFLTIADIAYANESIRAAVIVFNAFFEFSEGLFLMKHVLFRFWMIICWTKHLDFN